MIEVEGKACDVKNFLSTLMQVYIALGSANKSCIWRIYPSD